MTSKTKSQSTTNSTDIEKNSRKVQKKLDFSEIVPILYKYGVKYFEFDGIKIEFDRSANVVPVYNYDTPAETPKEPEVKQDEQQEEQDLDELIFTDPSRYQELAARGEI